MLEPKTFLTIRDLREAILALFKTGQVSLPIESGIYLTGGNVGWQTVTFQKTFLTAPAVVAQGTFKAGSYSPQYKVDIPSITVPSILLPIISIPPITVPNVTIPAIPYIVPRLNIRDMLSPYTSISAYMAAAGENAFLANTEWWTWTLVLAPIRTAISAVVYLIGGFVGGFFDEFVSEYIQPQLTNIENVLKKVKNVIDLDIIGTKYNPNAGSINRAFDDLENALQTALDGIIGGVNAGYEVLRDTAQEGFDTVTGTVNESSLMVEHAIEDAINSQIERLYEFLGILDGAPMVPTKVQNVTNRGFQLYSTGASQYSWVAVGI